MSQKELRVCTYEVSETVMYAKGLHGSGPDGVPGLGMEVDTSPHL